MQHEKQKRRDCFLRIFRRKAADPKLSLTALAREEGLRRTQVYERWRRYHSAVDDAGRLATCDNHSGGHNRVFTDAQSALVAEQVLAMNVGSNAAIRDIAVQMKMSIDAEENDILAHPRHLRSSARHFVASPRFITRLKRKFRLSSIRTKLVHQRKAARRDEIGPPRDIDRECEEYLVQVNCAIQDFGPHLVLNMDETPAKLAEVPRTAIRRTNSGEAAKINTYSNDRLNITTFPTISAGGDKLQMCAIIRGLTALSLRKVLTDSSDTAKKVKLYYSESGWINQGIMLQYIRDVIQPYTRNRRAALILDDYKAHWTEEVQKLADSINLTLIPVPNFKGATALLQPLDVQFNGPLKAKRMQLWASYHQRVPDSDDTYPNMIERVQLAYNAMSKDNVIAAFRKAQIHV